MKNSRQLCCFGRCTASSVAYAFSLCCCLSSRALGNPLLESHVASLHGPSTCCPHDNMLYSKHGCWTFSCPGLLAYLYCWLPQSIQLPLLPFSVEQSFCSLDSSSSCWRLHGLNLIFLQLLTSWLVWRIEELNMLRKPRRRLRS